MSQVRIRSFVSPMFAQNAFLVSRDGETSAVAIDPGSEADAMADALAQDGLWLEAILLTHAHIDHIEGVARLVARTGAATWMHPADAPFYQRVDLQAAQFGMDVDALPPIDNTLDDGAVLHLAGIDFEVRHVPGHSPGHVILYAADAGVAFVGDVIFQRSVGRTDLPGGSFPLLIGGIRKHVLTLPDDTVLYTGHGPATTVGEERVGNPFLVPQYGGGFA